METTFEKIKKYYEEYCLKEFEQEPDEFTENDKIGVAYTDLGEENEYPCQVYIDLKNFEITYEFNYELQPQLTEKYNSLEDIADVMRYTTFEDYISPFYDLLPEEEQ